MLQRFEGFFYKLERGREKVENLYRSFKIVKTSRNSNGIVVNLITF